MTEGKSSLWTRDFILICAANFFVFTAFQMLMPTLPHYVGVLGGSEGIIGLVTGIFTISAVAIRPWLGLEIDRRGRRGIYLAGLLVFVIIVAGYQWAGSILALLLLRVLHGIGWGGSTTAGGTIAADLIPPSRRGEGMGYYGLFSNLAMAVAPALGLAIMRAAGFPHLFTTSALLAVIALLLVLVTHIPPAPPSTAGGVKPALFEPTALVPGLVMFFVTVTWGGIVSFLSLYAESKGILNIGIYFTVYAVVLMAVRPLAGAWADRRGAAVVIIPGLICVTAAMAILAAASSLSWLLAAAVINGLGFGATQPTLQALTIERAPLTRRGAANATFFSAFDLGIGAGSVSLGLVAGRWGYAWMYTVAAFCSLVGLIVFLAQKNSSIFRAGRKTKEFVEEKS